MCSIKKNNIVSIIPARGGSKGIPGKNIKPLLGKPLIGWTIKSSVASNRIDTTFVSTDSSEIARVSESFGAKVISRPAKISGDQASSEDALLHFLDFLEENENILPDYVVFLQCTSPIRGSVDIDQAIDKIIHDKADSLLSVVPNHRFIWESGCAGFKSINYDYKARQRRQDLNPQYMENGSIYIFKPWVLREKNNRLGGKVTFYTMARESGFEIDNILDFELCEFIMKRKTQAN
jgi:CMP-N,N'-diacetyllegionaminic acid synthase